MVSPQRIYFLDHLKILLATMVILVHAGQPYGPGGDWPIDALSSIPVENIVIIGIFFAVSSSFFMGLFFFVSAYFLPGSYERKGEGQFLRDRFRQLGIPLVLWLLIVFPLMGYFLYAPAGVGLIPYYQSFTVFATGDPGFLSFGYLWFIVALILFSLGYCAFRRTRISVGSVPTPALTTLFVSAVVLGMGSFAVRIWFPFDEWILFHTIEPAHLPQYLLFFAAGVLASRNGWLVSLPSAYSRIWSGVVIAGIGALMPILLIFGFDITAGGVTTASFVYSMWEAFVGIGMCVLLVLYFRDRFDSTGPLRKTLSRNVYAVYLIHFPIVLSVQWLLISMEIPSLGKFFIVGISGVLLSFMISNYVVRKIPYIDGILFR
jgi:glucan biosynthesis protein C